MMNRSLIIGAVLSFSVGCGTSFSQFCEDQNLCEEGNELDIDACTASFETSAELADLRNCGAEFDEVFDCYAENSRCNDGSYGPDEDTCRGAEQRLQECVQ
jgi:hypothetical protein